MLSSVARISSRTPLSRLFEKFCPCGVCLAQGLADALCDGGHAGGRGPYVRVAFRFVAVAVGVPFHPFYPVCRGDERHSGSGLPEPAGPSAFKT